MAWASAELSAADVAAMAADKPLFVGGNALEDADELAWSRSYTQSPSITDNTDANGPIVRLYDGFEHLRSYGDATDTEWMVHIDFGASGASFDTIAVLNHNLGSIGITNLSVHVSDDAAYTTRFTSILSDGNAGDNDKRLVYLSLKDTGSNPRLFTSVQYVRFYIYHSTTAVTPQIGELIFAQRTQMDTKPMGNFDPKSMTSKVMIAETPNGSVSRHVHHYGRRKLSAQLVQRGDSRASAMDAFYETDTAFGTKPFLWVQNPTSDPQDAPLMLLDSNNLSAPTGGFGHRVWSVNATEQGPNFVSQETT